MHSIISTASTRFGVSAPHINLRLHNSCWPQVETDAEAGDGEAAAAGGAVTDDEAVATAAADAVQPDAVQPPAAAAAAEPDEAAKLEALEKEAKDKNLGKLYAACGGGEEGLRACVAVEALCEVRRKGPRALVHSLPGRSRAGRGQGPWEAVRCVRGEGRRGGMRAGGPASPWRPCARWVNYESESEGEGKS